MSEPLKEIRARVHIFKEKRGERFDTLSTGEEETVRQGQTACSGCIPDLKREKL